MENTKELLKPQQLNLDELNSGFRYKNGDVVHAEVINRSVESAVYTQTVVKNLLKPPDISEANRVGVASVDIGADGAFKFTNLKGEIGTSTTLSIGTVIGGVEAAADIIGEAPNQTLNLTLPKGDSGAIYVPTVSDEGVISWSNDAGLTNPTSKNIKGPIGPKGEDGSMCYVNNVLKPIYNVNRLAIKCDVTLGANWEYVNPYFVFKYLMPKNINNLPNKYFVVHSDDKMTATAFKDSLAQTYIEYENGYIKMFFKNMNFGAISLLIDVLER